MQSPDIYDCIIIGGGPAGLNAAVVLGRCRRKVLLFDTEQYRNMQSHGTHNYLTRDDILPSDFLGYCRNELEKYSVQRLVKKIVSARRNEDGLFVAKDELSTCYYSRKLLVATGLSDNVPAIPGFRECYGQSVFHCPYCDGWEVREKKIGVYAKNKEGWELALSLKTWSPHITLYTDGRKKIKPSHQDYLEANGVTIITMPIERLGYRNRQVEQIIFKNGETRDCDALFFVNGYTQRCDLAEAFGCSMTKKNVVITNRNQQTDIPGLYVAGDASRDMHFVVVAAAEGAKAGVTINKELQKESWVNELKKATSTSLKFAEG